MNSRTEVKKTYTVKCGRCSTVVKLKAYPADMFDWQHQGVTIQNALPYLNCNEREILISGTCGPCFDSMFPTG